MTQETKTKPVALTYEERTAVTTIRKSMRSKPEIVDELLKGQSYELAQRVLIKVRDELNQLLEVNRAFSSAAAVLAKQQKGVPDETL